MGPVALKELEKSLLTNGYVFSELENLIARDKGEKARRAAQIFDKVLETADPGSAAFESISFRWLARLYSEFEGGVMPPDSPYLSEQTIKILGRIFMSKDQHGLKYDGARASLEKIVKAKPELLLIALQVIDEVFGSAGVDKRAEVIISFFYGNILRDLERTVTKTPNNIQIFTIEVLRAILMSENVEFEYQEKARSILLSIGKERSDL